MTSSSLKRKNSQRWTPNEHAWNQQVFLQYTSEMAAARNAFRDAPDDLPDTPHSAAVAAAATGGATGGAVAPHVAFISTEEKSWETSHTFKFPACEYQSPRISVERSHRPRADCCLSCNRDLPAGITAARCAECSAAFNTLKCCRCNRTNLTPADFPPQTNTVSPCFQCLRYDTTSTDRNMDDAAIGPFSSTIKPISFSTE